MLDFSSETAREQMIEQQIRATGVLAPQILALFRKVPREQFVPEAFATLAWADCEIPIGHDESMMSPMIEGQLLDSLAIRPAERILEIGTGSGFLTACLASLGSHVTTLDLHTDFIDQAQRRHRDLGLPSPIDYRTEDGHRLPASLHNERFDIIVLSGSLHVPEPSFSQALAPGGRLWVVIGTGPIQKAHRIERAGGSSYNDRVLFETRLKPLTHAPKPTGFSWS